MESTSGITTLSVADFIEPALGKDDLVKLLRDEARGKSPRDQLPYAEALIRRGDYTLGIELEKQDSDDTARIEARKLIEPPGIRDQERERIGEVSAYPSGSTSAILDVRSHAYEANPTDDAYLKMLEAELIDSRSSEPRYRAAYFVSRALYYAGRGDLLRKRLADLSSPPQARATALEMLARLGDSEIILAQLNDPSLSGEVLDALPKALELIGLQEHLSDVRSRIALNSQSSPSAREMQFRALTEENPASAERIATSLVKDPALPRSVRHWALIYLAAKCGTAIDELAAFAAEDPANCGDILNNLANAGTFCTRAALAVLRATSPAPMPHMHVLNQLVRGRSSEEVSILLDLAERVDFNCEGHANVLSQITEVLTEEPAQLTDAQLQKLAKVAAAKLRDPRATGLASAAILLWNIGDQASWMDAFTAAVELIPDRYRVFISELSIPVEIRTSLARRLSSASIFEIRLLAAIELCELGQVEEGYTVFHALLALEDVSAKLAWKRTLGDFAFADAISRFSLEDRLGEEIAGILVATISTWGPLPLTPSIYHLFDIILRSAATEHREELLDLFQSMEGTLLKSLWDAAVANARGEFLEAIQSLWFICLRIPDQPWIRRAARVLAVKAEASDWNTRLLIDEFSFFRRKNELALAELALEELKSTTGGLAAGLNAIAAADRKFDMPSFLANARETYESVVLGYARGDRALLKERLSEEVFDGFDAAIQERESRNETAESRFVAIEAPEIAGAIYRGRLAQITVRFRSKMVSVTRNSAGAVVDGSLDSVTDVSDTWTFARDISSPDRTWKLVATEASK